MPPKPSSPVPRLPLTAGPRSSCDRGIHAITGPKPRNGANSPSAHDGQRMYSLRNRIAAHLVRSDVAGVVITPDGYARKTLISSRGDCVRTSSLPWDSKIHGPRL